MLRILLFSQLFLIGLVSNSQGQSEYVQNFQNYALHQDSIFLVLYTNRAVDEYEKTLAEWLANYNQLPGEDQLKFRQYLANAYYNLACTHALNSNIEKALQALKSAIANGYTNYAHILEDPDLDQLRKLQSFQHLLEGLREVGDYLHILKKSKSYNDYDQRMIPDFIYEDSTQPELIALRKKFRLDSIAGKGNNISKVLALLHWVHELVPHDGNHQNPPFHTADSLIMVCRKESRGLNCRGLATIMNEICLAEGFRSRLVTCLPKDSLGTDPDCHVINTVFIPELKKWIWVDPTNDAYVMNEMGDLLSIDEVRQRIISGGILILNPTANWNHQSSLNKAYYLNQYMAKNLFMLQCPVISRYNLEGIRPGQIIEYVQLIPAGVTAGKQDITEFKRSNGVTYRFYYTQNSDKFWKLP